MGDRVRFAGTLAAITALYVVAGRLGLTLAGTGNANVTAVWPPAGIAVAALLLVGLRAWPAIAAGAFLTNVTLTGMPTPSLAIAAGNTLSAVAGAVLANRVARGWRAFERGTDSLRFVAVAALLAPVIAATIGTVALRGFGLAGAAESVRVWFTWWLGDASGVALAAPLCVLWATPSLPVRASRSETLALAGSAAAVLALVFGASTTRIADMPLAVLMLPLLLWSAFRFNTRTTATLSVAMSAIVVYRVMNQIGWMAQDPSLGPSPAPSPGILLAAQSLVAIVSILMLAVAAEAAAGRRMDGELRQLNETLERRVGERTIELSRVHDRLVEAQEVAHVGSWEWNVATDEIWWSAELCRIFGTVEPPGGYHTYLSLVHPDDRDRTDAAVGEAARTGRPFTFDHRIVRPDGEERVLHAKGRVEMDASGKPIRMMGIGHDITEQRRAEAARAELIREQTRLREVEEANRAKDAFLATLSHELRTPLNAALGWAHILRDSARGDGRDARAVQAIYRNLQVQSRLVEDILDISRIVKGDLPLERGTVDMAAVFENASEMLRQSAVARRVAVDVTAAGATTVAGDTRRLQQVAWNLLDNAVKFAAEGGRVAVSIAETPDGVECAVEDDGPGIAPEFLPHVFEQFRQADASATRAHGGLGLGLAIAQEIVRGHGGTIAAANSPRGGAVFLIRLPRVGVPAVAGAGRPASAVQVRDGV
jgi:PAS domain S-box-containing protein